MRTLFPRGFAALAVAAGLSTSLLAEDVWATFSGQATTFNSSLRLKQSGNNTDLVFRDVNWVSDSLTGSPYYGLRFSRFKGESPWGWSVEFLHYKAIAPADQRVRAIGTENGNAVDREQNLGDTIQRLRFANGVNNFFVNLVGRSDFKESRWRFYGGVGGGPVVIFRAALVNGEYEDGYQYVSLGYQLFGGAEYKINDHLGFMVEGKYTNLGVKVGVSEGDVHTRLTTKHIAMGFTYRR